MFRNITKNQFIYVMKNPQDSTTKTIKLQFIKYVYLTLMIFWVYKFKFNISIAFDISKNKSKSINYLRINYWLKNT